MIAINTKHVGKQTLMMAVPPSISGHACVAGKLEGEGPMRNSFDYICDDPYFGEKTFEKAESIMQKKALSLALNKAGKAPEAVNFIFAGDLLNQCIGSSFSLRDEGMPFFGVYGACSTMAESLALASMAIDGGFGESAAALTSSHFCGSERQFRFPLEYGGQRTPSAQRTVTGAGAAIVTADGPGPYITHVTVGKIIDNGIKDANNMGAAMMPAAYDTLSAHFEDLSIPPSYYDLIVTGDLGAIGADMLADWFSRDGVDISANYNDCGLMMFERKAQDVHAGGSGCGCSATILCGHLLNGMRAGKWQRILFAATGALLSPVSTMQGESIPSICYAVAISNTK